jgi:hypothetical protein
LQQDHQQKEQTHEHVECCYQVVQHRETKIMP